MASSRAVIPRFLLPLQSPLWRGIRLPLSPTVGVRFASTGGGSSSPDKPIVLEKPLKFNPPSHGSRLKKNALPKHYGPTLTPGEKAAQAARHYPGLMAPPGTWQHWFWHSRALHLCITLGTLFSLAIATFFMNYAYNSPFKDLVPPISDLWNHPLYFFVQWKNVIVMHEEDKGRKTYERRMQHLDDVAKRKYYMKSHGIEVKDPISVVFGKGTPIQTDAELEAQVLGLDPPPKVEGEQPQQRKKWLGIF
ncbi:hypothetical protein B0I35DRAFT_478516 [Stachybotrys elegans]|uniref:Uncharacterized protein n=1 Tax=Stachybotrys elegans TaxID=80388 RepID=A0A8K0WRS1_9HYPO|nr:hypothetical protein B0I35DRAFT_478516 [Stachybotrys elegans]